MDPLGPDMSCYSCRPLCHFNQCNSGISVPLLIHYAGQAYLECLLTGAFPEWPLLAGCDRSPLPRRVEGRQTWAVRPRCLSVASLAAGRAGGMERGEPQAGAVGRVSWLTFLSRDKKVSRLPGRDPASVAAIKPVIASVAWQPQIATLRSR